VHHVSIFNKPTRCSWAVTFITALLDYSTCFRCFLHPSSGVQLYMQPLAQVHIGRPEFKLCHVERRSSDAYLCQRLHIQLLYSWRWVQEAPKTCRVVKKCSNKGNCPAASCWFIKYSVNLSSLPGGKTITFTWWQHHYASMLTALSQLTLTTTHL